MKQEGSNSIQTSNRDSPLICTPCEGVVSHIQWKHFRLFLSRLTER